MSSQKTQSILLLYGGKIVLSDLPKVTKLAITGVKTGASCQQACEQASWKEITESQRGLQMNAAPGPTF